MKYNVKVDELIMDAYAEYNVGWDVKSNTQTLNIDLQIGDSEIFADMLKENGRANVCVTSKSKDEFELE